VTSFARRALQRSGQTVANLQRNMEQAARVEMKIAAHYKNSPANEASVRNAATFRG
jgi:hypothetical protein